MLYFAIRHMSLNLHPLHTRNIVREVLEGEDTEALDMLFPFFRVLVDQGTAQKPD